MPFDKTQVKPEVAALLKVREWIAVNGFCADAHDEGSGAGCFWYAARKVSTTGFDSEIFWSVIDPVMTEMYGPRRLETQGWQEDLGVYLRRNQINTESALEIIDAAIARVS